MADGGQWFGGLPRAGGDKQPSGGARIEIERSLDGRVRGTITISDDENHQFLFIQFIHDQWPISNADAQVAVDPDVVCSTQPIDPSVFVEGVVSLHEDDLIIHGHVFFNGTKIDFIGARSDHKINSEIKPSTMEVSWEGFKKHIYQFKRFKYIYRGQSGIRPIRSSFHRKNKWVIYDYFCDTIPYFASQVAGYLGAKIDLENDHHVAELLSLARHHDFPTPLIDWTYSPYVAAFFAFQKRSRDGAPAQVFVFDHSAVNQMNFGPYPLSLSTHYLYVKEIPAIGNTRHLPQQSLSMITNIDQVYSYISFLEKRLSRRLLAAFSIDAKDRERALADLAAMGVTAASLFPGLDGVCEALRGRLFGDYAQLPDTALDDVFGF